MADSKKVRVRFAPSPTGYLHVGGARTALYNWLYAQKTDGTFVLRVEDTDQARSTEEALQMQLSDLKWLGITWSEGPEVGGAFGPYKQSQRLHLYKEHALRLINEDKAYYCFCDDQTLERKKQAALAASQAPHYDGTCRGIPKKESLERLARGETAVVRFNIGSPKETKFNDLIRNEVVFPEGMVGDFVLLRSDGMPVYNFCCVVDDALMQITHVLRAEEHLSNTLRQLMIYEAFKYTPPLFGHLSIILGPDRQKLSKRHGATSCNEYRKMGFLPEALNNFIALLGWSSPEGQEILSMKEMVSQFSLDRFTPSAAVFDETKLKWVNSIHLRNLSSEELWGRLKEGFAEAKISLPQDPKWIDMSLNLLKPYMTTMNDAVDLYRPLSDAAYELSTEGRETMKWEGAVRAVTTWKEMLSEMKQDYLTESDFLKLQDEVKEKAQVKGKFLFQPIRVAIIGKPQGSELKQLVPLLKRSSLIERASKALV